MNIPFKEACERLKLSDINLIRYIEYFYKENSSNVTIFSECERRIEDIPPWREDGHWAISPEELYKLIFGPEDILIVECIGAKITHRKCYLDTLEISQELFDKICSEINSNTEHLPTKRRSTYLLMIAALLKKPSNETRTSPKPQP